MTAQPYKTWRLFDCTEDAIAFRREQGTGGWIFSIADNDEAILFPWQMPPREVLDSVFVRNRDGYLIGADDKRRPQDRVRELSNAAPFLGRIVKPFRCTPPAPSDQIGTRHTAS